MGFGIKVRAKGAYALFTRPEFKVERVSYDVITPSAARGLIQAIFWKPQISWVIDKIHVLNEIKFTDLRGNEISQTIKPSKILQAMAGSGERLYIDASGPNVRTQRASRVLVDVDYIIEAHFEINPVKLRPEDNPKKYYNMTLERLRKGEFFTVPCLGLREFPADVTLIEEGEPLPKSSLIGEQDMGRMLYEKDYSDPDKVKPRFFHAIMRDGIIDLRDVTVEVAE